jgi:tRNA(fMet)-specific endonuclease VapC
MSSAKRKIAVYKSMTSPHPVGQCEIVDMGEIIWDIAKEIYVSLYRNGFTVGEIDILIGAFCLQHGYTLVTANTKDFKNMNGLKIENWWID